MEELFRRLLADARPTPCYRVDLVLRPTWRPAAPDFLDRYVTG